MVCWNKNIQIPIDNDNSVPTNKSETLLQTLAKLRIQQKFIIKKSTHTNLVTMKVDSISSSKMLEHLITWCRNPTEGHYQIHCSFKGITLYNTRNYFVLRFMKRSTHWRMFHTKLQILMRSVYFMIGNFFKDMKISAPNHYTELQPAWIGHCLAHLITANQCYTHFKNIYSSGNTVFITTWAIPLSHF